MLRLQLENFRVIRSAVVPFDDDIIGVIGPNGAGKSSLVEAIVWALYGNQGARSGRDEIKSQFASPGDNCRISLDFTVGAESYRVERRLIGRQERLEAEVHRSGKLVASGARDVLEFVTKLLGLDFRGFLTSFMARQQELNTLSDIPPAQRKDYLAGMLGVERLDRAITGVREESRLAERSAELIDRQLAGRAEIDARFEQVGRRMVELTTACQMAEAEAGQAQAALRETAARLQEQQAVRDQWLQMTTRREAIQQTDLQLRSELTSVQDEIARLEAHRSEREELVRVIAGLAETQRLLDEQEQRRLAAGQREDLEAQRRRAEADRDTLAERLRQQNIRLAELGHRLSELPADLERLRSEAESALEAERHRYSETNAELLSVRDRLKKLREQQQSIAEMGPDSVCDRCGRRLGDDLAGIKAHLEGESQELTASAENLTGALDRLTQAGKQCRETLNRLSDQVLRRSQLESEKSAQEREISTTSASLAAAADLLSDLRGRLEKLGSTPFDTAEYERLRKVAADLQAKRSRQDHLSGILQRLPQAQTRREELAARLERTRAELESLDGRLGGLSYRPEQYDEARRQNEQAGQVFEAARARLQDLVKEQQLSAAEQNSLQERREEFTRLEEEREQARQEHYYGVKLGSLLVQFRENVITTIRPSLAHYTGRLFSEMTDERYSLVELDEQYNLRIMDNGQFFGVERFSGGEKDLANLCLRLAISLALTDAAGLNRTFIILDEVFGSQDDSRKELIVGALARLRSRFPQIILITHVDELKYKVPRLIEVRPTGRGYSEVLVNNVVV